MCNQRWVERIVQTVSQNQNCDMRCHHVCVITRGKKIVTTGVNSSRTMVDGQLVSSLHAEHDAIRQLTKIYHENQQTKSGKDCFLDDHC
jgi:deoxycytidylate deaminase